VLRLVTDAVTADTAETIFHRPGTASSVTRAQNHQNATMDKPAAQDAAAPVRIIPAQISPVTAGMEQDRQHGKHVILKLNQEPVHVHGVVKVIRMDVQKPVQKMELKPDHATVPVDGIHGAHAVFLANKMKD